MRALVAFPVLILALILQTAVVGRLPLLAGFADLMLLILAAWSLQERVTTAWHWAALATLLTGFVSKVPWVVYLAGYLAVVALGRVLQRRVWEASLLGMFTLTFSGTLLLHVLMYLALLVQGRALPLETTFLLVTVPSLLLNLLLAMVVYPLIRDLAEWAYPPEE